MAQTLFTTVHPGMKVFAGSEEIGKVTAVWDRDFEVTRGLIFRHVYVIPAQYVADVGEGIVDLKIDKDAVERLETGQVALDDLPEEYRQLESIDDWYGRDDPTDRPLRH
jgi:hypothetical protein